MMATREYAEARAWQDLNKLSQDYSALGCKSTEKLRGGRAEKVTEKVFGGQFALPDQVGENTLPSRSLGPLINPLSTHQAGCFSTAS
jgi:hypothetical protein